MSGANAVITKHLQSKGLEEATEINKLTTEEYNAAIGDLIGVYDNLSARRKDELSEIYNHLGEYSYGQLEGAFANFGGTENNPLWDAYESLWID
jgi:hypothetical protein